ncbi:MAG: M24 family metallopeptidase [Steroidobacteraceae bacterium]
MSETLAALFPAHLATLCERATAALAATGYRGLLLQAGSPLEIFLDDQHYPFRAHAPFKAWVPLLDAPQALVWFEPGRRPCLVFPKVDDYWHKPARLPESWWTPHFEVREVRDAAGARAALPASLARAAYIGTPFPELLGWGVAAINPQHLLLRLDYPRAAKTPYEIACLREATRLGVHGHRCPGLRGRRQRIRHPPGLSGRVRPARAGAALQRHRGAQRGRRRAALPGARAPPSAERRSLLIDAGAEFAGYASDITRTLAGPAASGGFGELVAGMDRLQQGLCARVRAGVDWRDIHLASVEAVAGLLCESGILRCGPDEAVGRGLVTKFYPHGIGHLLGLQVHDVGGRQAGPEGGELPTPAGHPALRLTRRLEDGFVVTMEPGLYFIDALLEPLRQGPDAAAVDWRRVEQLRPCGGIRIEDDLVVRGSGCENLTREAFSLS